MASELIGLTDDDLDLCPDPKHVAGNDRTPREVCEHVMDVQRWITSGIESGLADWRAHRDG